MEALHLQPINQSIYEQLKRKVTGYYFKFNTQVLRFHMNKMFNYEYLLETAKDFENFEQFYNFHTEKKQDIIDQHIKQMYYEANNKGLNTSVELVKKCIIVRLGNIYNGMYTENLILKTFSTLNDFIICEKTPKEIDTLYKVDAVIELVSVDRLAIQIKPYSFTKYDKGSELQYHNRYTLEFGPSVYYVFYKDKNTIIFNGEEIKLSDYNKIIEQIVNILVYNN